VQHVAYTLRKSRIMIMHAFYNYYRIKMDLEEEGKELTEFRTKYNQCKAMVVKWEIAFGKEKGRNPTRVRKVMTCH